MLRIQFSFILGVLLSVACCAYVASENIPVKPEMKLKRKRRKLDSIQIEDVDLGFVRRELGIPYSGSKGSKGSKGDKGSGKGGSKGGSGKGSKGSKGDTGKGSKGDSSGKGDRKGSKGVSSQKYSKARAAPSIEQINDEIKNNQIIEQEEAAALLLIVQSNMSMDTMLNTMDGTVVEPDQKSDELLASAEEVVQEIIEDTTGRYGNTSAAQGSFLNFWLLLSITFAVVTFFI